MAATLATAKNVSSTLASVQGPEICYSARRYAYIKSGSIKLVRLHLDLNWCSVTRIMTRRSYLDGWADQIAGFVKVTEPKHKLQKPSAKHWVQLDYWTVVYIWPGLGEVFQYQPRLKLDFRGDDSRTFTVNY